MEMVDSLSRNLILGEGSPSCCRVGLALEPAIHVFSAQAEMSVPV